MLTSVIRFWKHAFLSLDSLHYPPKKKNTSRAQGFCSTSVSLLLHFERPEEAPPRQAVAPPAQLAPADHTHHTVHVIHLGTDPS